ncbi:hypothetical protein ZYGR_0N01410 [Zygosaccharomyces rouxii]|uniref:ZYRO0D03630p n=2 Tax=Zygosaccharomyces rouxii TaxID=4956 RepID=C5DV39_ZYGRC|nr:uncharacterized protein ZYRO0D03630g [Zygosaccharomyces rouxii]KAH9200572.1 concanavalin A-like lectin/glucanase domain-containing protein [Zygosaccharomyces rouxii]GAV48737.1 hypothetical protein ZYGR_0N01410 [Zygosaccharomyces rouxii]CAR27658.1 ZYRO0D03630p [Zygosaccharomyces rouxii]
MKRDAAIQLVIITGILLLFAVGQTCWKNTHSSLEQQENVLHLRPSQVKRIENKDASLQVPFLDKISKHWYVGGSPEIRNSEYVRLTNIGSPGSHGSVVSNGLGDNTINDFEIVVKFRIMSKDQHRKTPSGNSPSMGDGMAIVISSEKDFVSPESYASGYARKQFDLNSGGVLLGNTEMMGFPKNLPGLSLVIDTFQNSDRSRTKIPFLDIHVNTSPRDQKYDFPSDGADTTALKLLKDPIRLTQRCVKGDLTQFRIIYMESINTLKIDAKYAHEGDYWIELFHSQLDIKLPKNSRNGQRYVGVGALTGQLTETVDVFSIETNEFHSENHDESAETSFDYAKEVQMFLAQEFDRKVSLEEDEFQKWKIARAQPNLAIQEVQRESSSPLSPPRRSKSIFGWFGKSVAFSILTVAFYLTSVYIRVSIKHINNTHRRKRAQSIGLLPI